MAFPTWLLSHHLTLPLLHTVFASTALPPSTFTLAALLVGQWPLRAPVSSWLPPALSIPLPGHSCFQAKSISPYLWPKAWNGLWTQLYAFKSSSVLLRGFCIDNSGKNKAQPGSQEGSQQWVKASKRQGLRAGTNIVFWKHELNILFLCALLEPAATPPNSARETQAARAWAKDSERTFRWKCCCHQAAPVPAATVPLATVPAATRLPLSLLPLSLLPHTATVPAARGSPAVLPMAGQCSSCRSLWECSHWWRMQCEHLYCAGSVNGASQGISALLWLDRLPVLPQPASCELRAVSVLLNSACCDSVNPALNGDGLLVMEHRTTFFSAKTLQQVVSLLSLNFCRY